MNKNIRHIVLPILAALIWGTAFVFQRESTEFVQPMTFNAARAVIAAIVLFITVVCFEKVERKAAGIKKDKGSIRDLVVGGICCGTMLAIASNFQQLGLGGTSAGKAGFITALYIVIVPILGIFVNKKASLSVWISVFIAAAGLYCLCIKEDFSLAVSDFYVLLCALVFALHIMVIDYFTQKVDGLRLSCAQFAVVAILSGTGAVIFEETTIADIMQCLWPILYVGVFSSGVAYTLQIIAQKDANPTTVSLLLSLESVFSVLAGAIMLNEVLTAREYLGCVLMLGAVVLAQLPEPKIKKSVL